jgi:N-acyl-D-aspartate/D-glutamate deacylase
VIDCVIRGGTVVDGTGAARRRADVAIADGRIVEVGAVPPTAEAARVIDATDRVVAPGVVDIHTHLDAQAFWDPGLTPSPLHGVTTVVAGNCGLSLAPLDPANQRYTLELLARVEGMPVESLEQGVPWGTWSSFAEYLAAVEPGLAINAGVLVGHNAVRLTVMGADVRRPATPDEVAAMVRLLEESLEAGGLGLSTSRTHFHRDGAGLPVPSSYATRDELLALARAVGRHPGTTLQITGTLGPFDDAAVALMADLSLAADRPINWNSLIVDAATWDDVGARNLAASDAAARRGASVHALTFAIAATTRLNFVSGVVLDGIPGWGPVFAERDLARRAALLADPAVRRELAAGAAGAGMPAFTDWPTQTVGEVFAPAHEGLAGRTIGDIAAERGRDPFDCLLDIVVADDLRTVLVTVPTGDDDESWRLRGEVFPDPRVIIGSSDAGAHLDMIDAFAYPTDVLGPSVRARRVLTLEEAVRLLSDVPARAYGLVDRGRLVPGAHADVVVFDPDRIGHGPIHLRADLPGGARRLAMAAEGIDHVLVAGRPVVRGTALVEGSPGRALRSGRDTTTVPGATLADRIR